MTYRCILQVQTESPKCFFILPSRLPIYNGGEILTGAIGVPGILIRDSGGFLVTFNIDLDCMGTKFVCIPTYLQTILFEENNVTICMYFEERNCEKSRVASAPRLRIYPQSQSVDRQPSRKTVRWICVEVHGSIPGFSHFLRLNFSSHISHICGTTRIYSRGLSR